MLQPKRTKYRKQQKGKNRGLALRGSSVSFGEYGLKATGRGRLTARQIEAARRAMTRYVKRGGKIWIRVFPDKPVTAKPAETRQGKGKGSVEYWVAQIQPGRVLYEIEGVTEELAREAVGLAAAARTWGVAVVGGNVSRAASGERSLNLLPRSEPISRRDPSISSSWNSPRARISASCSPAGRSPWTKRCASPV